MTSELDGLVKRLEWEDTRRKSVASEDHRAIYFIDHDFGEFSATRCRDGETLYEGSDLSEAKAAAQADYAHRILSALNLDALDALRSGTVGEAGREPDYYYDPEDWEYTCDKTCLDELAESLLDYGGREGKPARISTLFKGPDKWVVRVPLDTDGGGEPDDWGTIWFDNEDDALRALAETKEAGE